MKIKRFACLAVMLAAAATIPALAAPGDIPTDIEGLWRYIMDTVEHGITHIGDKSMNAISEFLFGIVKFFGWMVVKIVDVVMSANLAASFTGPINNIQTVLKSSVFDSLFILAFCGAAFMLAQQIIKRSMQGALGEIGKVILIMALAIFVTTNSGAALAGNARQSEKNQTGNEKFETGIIASKS